MKSATLLLACSLLLLSFSPLRAEIVKTSVPCESNNCLYWWPKAPVPAGWHYDKKASEAGGINALAPDGSDFSEADTVIYARAMYMPLVPTITSLPMLISEDKNDFLSRDPKMTISEAGTISTGDGNVLRVYSYSPGSDGSWEQVAYGQEEKFFLIFTVSSKTRDGLAEAQESYRQFIKGYKAEKKGDIPE